MFYFSKLGLYQYKKFSRKASLRKKKLAKKLAKNVFSATRRAGALFPRNLLTISVG
jgi:hypothetical protein